MLGKGAGTSDGTISAITDGGNGTYTATFTGTAAGTARTITATIGGAALTSALPAITVLPPPPSLAQSTVSVGAATVPSGTSTTLTLTVRDAGGTVLTGGGLTVAFSLGAGTSTGTISAVTDNANGTYTASFTGLLAGSARAIGATIGGQAVTSTLPTITVTPGAVSLAQSTVTVGASSIASGASTTLTLITRDAAGNRLASGGLVVAFTKGAGTSDGTISALTDGSDGSYTATFAATTSGTARTIGATIGGNAITSALPTISVTAGAASLAQSSVTVGASALLSGASTTLTLIARDAAGNRLASGGLVVAFTKGTGTSDGMISTVADGSDGSYTATFAATTSGTARTIGATIGGQALTSTAPTITVTPGAPSPATSTITLSRTALVIGDTATLELTARDAAGNLVGTGGATVAFIRGAGTSDATIGATTDLGDGRYRAIVTATVAGTARSIGATIGGVTVTTPSVSLTVSAVPPSLSLSTVTVGASTVASGTSTTLTLTARDAGGNVITGGGFTVAFTLGAGTSTGTISAVTDNSNGTYTATFTGVLAGTARAIGATIGAQAVTSAAPSITVTPGAVSLAQSTLATGAGTLTSGTSTLLTLTARDAAGNALTAGGLTVAFTKGAGTSDGTISATTDLGNGTYRATFTATTAGSARTVGATIGGNAITSALPTIAVTPGAVSLAQSSVTVGASSIASGASTTLTLIARDAAGNRLAAGGLVVAFTKGTGTSDGTISGVTDGSDGSYTATFAATTSGTARTIGATIGGNAITSTLPTITVTAGAVSLAQSTVTVGASSIVSGASTTLTLIARDAAGNRLASGGLVVLFTKGTGASDGTISAVTDGNDGSYTATFTATTAGTARTIGATIGGNAITSVLPTITVTPGAVSLAQSSVTAGAASILSGASTTLTLIARDAAGNRLASGGLVVAFTKGTGTSDGTISAVTDGSDGSYTATFAATTAGTARTIGATIGGNAITSTLPTITVTPGAVSLAQSTVTVGAPTLLSGASTTLTLIARDAAGNRLASGGLVVVFTKGTGTSNGTISAVTDGNDGSYTATFLATTSGTARAISATIGGQPLTSVAPTVTVNPGAISPATSTIVAAPTTILLGQVSTLTLTGRDAAGNLVTTGGATVVFTKVSGSADGPLSATTDVGNGTYTATFTAATGGAPRVIGATINGAAVTTTLPAITVTAPPDMVLGAAQVSLAAQQGALSDSVLVAVANVGGDSIAGLSTALTHVSGPATCSSISWLLTPTFDKGGIAKPVSLMRLRANAAGVELGTCVRRVVVSSTTPNVTPETTFVSLIVGRSSAATGVVNVVMMGDASNNVVQTILPTPVLTIDNGGRGTVTNLSASIISQTGFAECVDPFDEIDLHALAGAGGPRLQFAAAPLDPLDRLAGASLLGDGDRARERHRDDRARLQPQRRVQRAAGDRDESAEHQAEGRPLEGHHARDERGHADRAEPELRARRAHELPDRPGDASSHLDAGAGHATRERHRAHRLLGGPGELHGAVLRRGEGHAHRERRGVAEQLE